MSQLRQQIVEAMSASRLTRYEIAKRGGFQEAQLSRLANGKPGTSLTTIEQLADFLGYDVRLVKRKNKSR
jgi:transcriptional regulator with XRE-family HTH domain